MKTYGNPANLIAVMVIVLTLHPIFAEPVSASLPTYGNISNTEKYAWAETAGWLNFRPFYAGVTVHDAWLEGYAWAENIGWIKMGSDAGGPYLNTTNLDWGVNRNGSILSGFGWSETSGWINFSPTNGGVSIDASGKFDGYAWGENIGWINFRSASPAYGVSYEKQGQNIAVTKSALSKATYDTTFDVAAASDSGLDVGITATGECSVSAGGAGSATILMTSGTGICTVRYNQAGDADYEAADEVTETATANKAVASVVLGSLSQNYNGSPRSATATTNPIGLTSTFTYDGSETTPTNAGSYVVVGTIEDFNYEGSASGTFVISKATPVITWSNPANITYGTALSGTELNATANVSGMFGYTPVSGTILNAGNGQTLHADFAPSDTLNYNSASKDVTINVNKADQTITFGPLPSKTIGDADFSPGAAASSGLTASYGSSNSSVATIVSGNVHIEGPGTSTITASQAGDANHNAAQDVRQTLTVTDHVNYVTTVTVSAATGNGLITLETDTPGCSFSDVRARNKDEAPMSDSSYSYPYGLVEFKLNCSEPGVSADVIITFPGSVAGATYRKYGPTIPGDTTTEGWYTFSGAIRSGNTVTLHLTDGALGDDTGRDAVIVDQGGPGQPAGSDPVAVPTMSEWGMIIFMALAGTGSIHCLRRRKRI